jgi:hypothetical protein
MPELLLHNRRVESVFSLLGQAENDITFSMGWALSRSPLMLQSFIRKALRTTHRCDLNQLVVALQEYQKGSGITDIEIRDADLHVIVEAKRGWILPSQGQLKRYVPRFRQTKAENPLIVTASECSQDYACQYLPSAVDGIPVRHVSWSEMSALSRFRGGSHAEKRLMEEFRTYIATIVNMQPQESNLVYVLALSTFEWAPGLNFIQTVEKRKRYFHPYGVRGWPKEPPNYIGFRYNGQLQSIHHVESAKVIKNFHPYFPEAPDKEEKEPLFLYRLGPPIRPANQVKSGKVQWSARRWAMLDLLLTSKTISEACEATKTRLKEI